jgi:hypothetical protein
MAVVGSPFKIGATRRRVHLKENGREFNERA